MNWWIPSKFRKARTGTEKETVHPVVPPDVSHATWGAFMDGDAEAFGSIYRQHATPVFRFLLAASASRELAEEVTQEVFVFLLREWRRYDPLRGTLEGWLIGISRQFLRQARNRRIFQELSEEPVLELPSDQPGVLDDMLRQERQQRLEAAIARLPETYRDALILNVFQSLPYAEIAIQLDCAVGTVRSRIARAKELLAADLHRSERRDQRLDSAPTTDGAPSWHARISEKSTQQIAVEKGGGHAE